jgi:hypothetical protein
MKLSGCLLACFAFASPAWSVTSAAHDVPQTPPHEFCSRPAPGSPAGEPQDLRGENGVLRVDLTERNERQADGSTRYCYVLGDGSQSPTLRLKPGELLILSLKNQLAGLA